MLNKILSQVHSNPSFERYKETQVRNNTNCYSHALGTMFPMLEIYRVGAISGNKHIDEKYVSSEEIKNLLFLDCKELQLKIEETSLEEKISDDEHKIVLFVKRWPNGQVADYHFWRYDNSLSWTEKWRGREMTQINDFQKEKLTYFPWSFEGIYKISRKQEEH